MRNISVFILFVGLLAGCTKKTVDLEVSQDLCKRFKIDAPNYFTPLLANPCDSGTRLIYDVDFTYKGDTSCVEFINLESSFYDTTGALMTGINAPTQVTKGEIFVNNNTIMFTYDVDFATDDIAKKFNYMILDFYTSNALGDQSNSLKLRVQMPCTKVTSDDYKVVSPDSISTVSPSQSFFPVKLWDNAAEDGDIVSVYLNGEWVIDYHSLLNAGTIFQVDASLLNPGSNDLVVFAHNEGKSGPNTVSIQVNNGPEIDLGGFENGLKTGNAVKVDF